MRDLLRRIIEEDPAGGEIREICGVGVEGRCFT